MKKVLAIVLSVAMILGLAACGSKAAAPAADAAAGKTYKVGVGIYQFTDNFMTLYRNEIESYFKEKEAATGNKYELTIVDGKNDMAEQTNQVENFITQKMDVIILNLVQTSSADAIVDKVVAAGIPLILINREPLGDNGDESYKGILDNANVCYVGADARQSGTFQGEIVADLANHGDINGDGKISYIMIEGDPENVDAQYRTEFSIKALTDAGYTVECLDDQVGNWDQTKGQELCANALAKFGKDIEVVFCNNDGMALGAYAALQAAGRVVGQDVYLLGVDALDECVEMVNNGTMTGTVLNDHIGQSHAAVDAACDALEGKALKNYYWVDYVKVTSDAAPAAAPAAAAPAADDYSDIKIGITMMDIAQTPFFQIMQDGAEAAAANYPGLTLTVLDGNMDASKQFDHVQDFVAQGYSGILDAPVDAGATQTCVDLAKGENGLPFIFLNTHGEGDVDCTIATDDILGGNMAADYAAEYLGGTGNVALLGWPELGNTKNRGDGFLQGVERNSGLTLAAEESYLGDAKKAAEIVENWITAGKQIDLIFAIGEPGAIAAVETILAYGEDIKVIGYDGNPEAKEGIAANPDIWIADIAQDPYGQGQMGIDLMVKKIRGEEIPSEVLVEPYVMDLAWLEANN